MATSASVSTPSSTGAVGMKGTAAAAPTAAPTPADARAAPVMSRSASCSVSRPGYWARSVAMVRIGTFGAISMHLRGSH